MKYTSSASGKLILSGEYAVVFGYSGIAIPAPFKVTATWGPSPSLASARFTLSPRERGAKHHDMTISYRGIENEGYLHRILDAVTKKIGPIHGHLTIENTIPIGRGMGSSTALVVAICRCLFRGASCHPEPVEGSTRYKGAMVRRAHHDTTDPIQNIALSIENTVNPGHSGLDFAVIWNEKPTIFHKGKPPQILDITINRLMGTFTSSILIDTGKPNETTPEMVKWIKEKACHPEPCRRATPHHGSTGLTMTPEQVFQTIANCTSRLLAGESPFTVFPDHHRAQVALGVVPKPIQALITDIEKYGGAAKVVGAGGRTSGGGIILALHPKPEKLLTIAKRHIMPIVSHE